MDKMTPARSAQARQRAIDLLDARELRQLVAWLTREATYEQLEELLLSTRWRKP